MSGYVIAGYLCTVIVLLTYVTWMISRLGKLERGSTIDLRERMDTDISIVER